MAERAGIEPATAGFIRLSLVLKTNWNTSPDLSTILTWLRHLGIAKVKKVMMVLFYENHFTRLGMIIYSQVVKVESAFNRYIIVIHAIPVDGM